MKKCSKCGFNAVVIDSYFDDAYCPGHALQFLHSMLLHQKEDKFIFRVVSDVCLNIDDPQSRLEKNTSTAPAKVEPK